jgi:hypothetical protein
MTWIETITIEQILLVLAVILIIILAVNIVIFSQISKLKQRIKNILGTDTANDIESSLELIHKKIQQHEKLHEQKGSQIESLEKRVNRSVQGVETLRFNPFKGNGGGGNQSFASSFVDESGNGVVISTLYSRERVSVYAKPINSFSSEHTLSEEEKRVLDKTKKRLENK